MSSDIPDHLELLLRLERRAGVSLERQLLEKLRGAILQGIMQAGWRLPSTRTLASALGISRNIVVAVYDELSVEGYLILRHGSGAYVNDDFSLPAQVAPPALARMPRWLPPAP